MAQSQVKNLCPEDEGCLSGTSSGHFFACQEGLVDPNKTIRGRVYVELFYGFLTPSSILLKPKSWLLGLTLAEPVKANSSAWSPPPLSSSLIPNSSCWSCPTWLRLKGSHTSPTWGRSVDRLGNSQCFFRTADSSGTSLAVQWLRLRASTVGSTGSIPGQGTNERPKKIWKNPKNPYQIVPFFCFLPLIVFQWWAIKMDSLLRGYIAEESNNTAQGEMVMYLNVGDVDKDWHLSY